MMRQRVLAALGGAALVTALTITPAVAAPGDNGQGVGGCVAGNLYGNTTNPRPSGHGVIPSQSPGPWVNNPADPDNPTPGPSAGDVQKGVHDTFGTPGDAGYTGRDVNEAMCLFP